MISFIVRLSNILFQPTLPLRGATEKGLKQKTVAESQPTLPLRGATPRCDRTAPDGARFNPRSPCGERPVLLDRVGAGDLVSTHAPLAGSDNAYNAMTAEQREFQPTLPLRGATTICEWAAFGSWKFQPTLPLRGATSGLDFRSPEELFQPTLPLRGATLNNC